METEMRVKKKYIREKYSYDTENNISHEFNLIMKLDTKEQFSIFTLNESNVVRNPKGFLDFLLKDNKSDNLIFINQKINLLNFISVHDHLIIEGLSNNLLSDKVFDLLQAVYNIEIDKMLKKDKKLNFTIKYKLNKKNQVIADIYKYYSFTEFSIDDFLGGVNRNRKFDIKYKNYLKKNITNELSDDMTRLNREITNLYPQYVFSHLHQLYDNHNLLIDTNIFVNINDAGQLNTLSLKKIINDLYEINNMIDNFITDYKEIFIFCRKQFEKNNYVNHKDLYIFRRINNTTSEKRKKYLNIIQNLINNCFDHKIKR